jgi:hypothetical protein
MRLVLDTVTEDHHYNILQQVEFPKVDIIGLDEAMKMIVANEA